MSNRHVEAKLAELKASHEAQIAALDPDITPGLSDEERVERFAEAAGFSCTERWLALGFLSGGEPVICSVWSIGTARKSLFAYMPVCDCPVAEAHRLSGIPDQVSNITPAHLPRFAEVQQEAWARHWRGEG